MTVVSRVFNVLLSHFPLPEVERPICNQCPNRGFIIGLRNG
jgi:hypothetical protein